MLDIQTAGADPGKNLTSLLESEYQIRGSPEARSPQRFLDYILQSYISLDFESFGKFDR